MPVTLTSYRSQLDKALLWLILIFVFFIPLSGKFLPPLIAAASVLWLINGSVKEKIICLRNSRVFFMLASFYLIHMIGMIYTSDLPEGLFDLEVKFSLFLFPVLIFGIPRFFQKSKNLIFMSFLSGNILASLICLIYAIFRSVKYNENYFTYSYFSLFHHTSYASIYILFSIIILVYFLFNRDALPFAVKKWLALCIIAIFCVIIYLLSSRTGIVAAILVLGFFTVYYFFIHRKWILMTLTPVFFISLIFLTAYNHPRFRNIVAFVNTPVDSVKMTSAENTVVRYVIVLQSLEVIKQNFILGTGTGDVKKSLFEKYRQKNIIHALDTKLNSHNQFLETFIGLGVPGILSLFLLVCYPLYTGFKTGNILLIAFSLIMIFNFMFESMLNTQAGVVFFAFFNTLLMLPQDEVSKITWNR